MDFMRSLEIAASGLSVSRTRMNVAASNLANANTTRTAEGGPYQRKNVIVRATPVKRDFAELLRGRLSPQLKGVEVEQIAGDKRPFRTIYDPGHPDADTNGIVKLPNVSMIEEMVDMITAARAYEAGVSTLQTIKAMASKALEIGK